MVRPGDTCAPTRGVTEWQADVFLAAGDLRQLVVMGNGVVLPDQVRDDNERLC